MDAIIRRPDISELETLVLAADRGSIAAAAQALRISRVAASKRLRALEILAGTDLIERSAGGVELTEAGRRVYEHARAMLAENDALLGTLGVIRSGERRTIGGMEFLIGLADASGRAPTTTDRLIATERLAAELFHGTPVPIAVIDPTTGVFEDVNTALCRMLGVRSSQLIGRTVEDLDVRLIDEEGTYLTTRLSTDGVLEDYPVAVVVAGDRHEMTVSSWPIRVGEHPRRFCILTDETAVHDLGRRLRSMTALADALDLPVTLTAPDGTLTYANRAFREVTGIDMTPGASLRSLVDVARSGEGAAAARAALARGETWRGTIHLIRPDGTPLTVEITAFPVNDPATGVLTHQGTIIRGVDGRPVTVTRMGAGEPAVQAV